MIWLPNEKNNERFTNELAEIYSKVGLETRRMAYVASVAVTIMAVTQISYILSL